jgi:LmbE family N-acetylglucosaminyl deacetylase
MAERLAPLTVVAPITSRPEPARGRVWRRVRRVVVAVIALGLMLAGTVYTAHFLSIERHAHEIRATSLVPPGLPARVLVIVARPGQELPMAGTLATLHESGTSVALLSLTADVGSEVGSSTVSARRSKRPPADVVVPEALAAETSALGVDSVAVAGFEPGELMLVDPVAVTRRIREAIRAERPSAIITVNDAQGGDRDSQAVAGYTLLAAGDPTAGVARVWTVARGAWERDWQALAGSPLVSQKSPTPQVAVRLLGDIAGVKSQALAAYRDYGTAAVVDAQYPAWDRLSSTLYLRFWDREYFALAWGNPVD